MKTDIAKEFQKMEVCYQQNWNDQSKYCVMPHTMRGKFYLDKITRDISIEAILDNNQNLEGSYYNKIPIFYAPQFLKERNGCKILVSNHYREISEQLKQLGYRENIDFMDMHQFVSLWYWNNKKEIHILEMHTAITTYCSLNCRNCNMFMNCYEAKQRKHIALEEFQENVINLFQSIDYCYRFVVLGGEPLLNMELHKMLQWLGENYRDSIGIIEIITNGTVLPREELLKTCKEYKIQFSISDYGEQVVFAQKLEQLSVLLKQEGILYEIREDMQWKEFYFPRKKQGVKFKTIREHMLSCNPIFRGINDNKFYYCHIVWSAVQAGLLPECETDYIALDKQLDETERKRLLAYDLGVMETGYVSLCKYCGGCGKDNTEIIPAGIQESKDEK